ncbi:DUF6086 family protein [Nocardia farcinica]|uniref:DUF6086 family protein n=1 Tax=Nocardia farcinica TaxID=37329 RepID=UPI001894566F|nr:DUF6086 family protein [Nocardia farcinica]MBF6521415.1 hypothetical protein [Nocardia farcinica]
MSFAFEVGDTTVWSPALRVGDLYVRMVSDVAALLGMPTGLVPVASDMWDIDLDPFEALVREMFHLYFETTHQVMKGMIAGVLAPSIVLLERGGRVLDTRSAAETNFVARARDLSMAP